MTFALSDITPEELASVDVKPLPPQAKQIIQLIGIEQAWLIFTHRGGRDLRIPVGYHHDTELHQLLELNAAALMIGQFSGQVIAVPKPDKIVQQIRNRRIYQARQQGESASELARHFNLTRRAVLSICKAMANQQANDSKRV